MTPLKVKHILFVILMLNSINHNDFVLSKNRFGPKNIVLGHGSLTVEHVPINAELQMTCRMEKPVWYRHGQLWSCESTLTIVQKKQEDAGLYSCSLSKLHDFEWFNLSLIVDDDIDIFDSIKIGDKIRLETEEDHDNYTNIIESPPKFKENDHIVNSIVAPSGSFIEISCPSIGYPTPITYWTRNDKPIGSHIDNLFKIKESIFIKDVTTEDSGCYKCTLCNKLDCIEHITNLTIVDRFRTAPKRSVKYPQNQTMLVNSSACFECVVLPDRFELAFMWFHLRNNEAIEELGHSVVDGYIEYFSLLYSTDPGQTSVLCLVNVTHLDEGWYACVANNTFGQSESRAYLKVIDKMPHEKEDTMLPSQPISVYVVDINVVLLLLMGGILVIYVLRKLRRGKRLQDHIEAADERVNISESPLSDDISCVPQMPLIEIKKQCTTFQKPKELDPTQALNEFDFPHYSNWEIQRSQLALGPTLGEGAFGRVVMAEAFGLTCSVASATRNSSFVAVKMVKEHYTDDDIASLVREMEVMKMVGEHINIINLLGCCTQNGPLWVIVEFAPHGNLKDFLRKNRPFSMGSPCSLQLNRDCLAPLSLQLTEEHLILFASQIAHGMEYLASRRCIHRDLAARNILVSDDYVMKIADFGLARDIQGSDYYRKKTNGRLPIKWMAPESLQEMFYDSQSDVWSYGVLLWEIMTYGEKPYPNIMSAADLYNYLISGQRMEKPSRCSLNIYMLMHQCWNFNSNARPTFGEIEKNLQKILHLATKSDEVVENLPKPLLKAPPMLSNDGEYLEMSIGRVIRCNDIVEQ